MVGPNGLKCKPGFYYEFITVNKTSQKSQTQGMKSTQGLGEKRKRKSNAILRQLWLFSSGTGSLSLGGDGTTKP